MASGWTVNDRAAGDSQSVAGHDRDHESEKAGRVMEALLQMKKIDIAALGPAAAVSMTAGAHARSDAEQLCQSSRRPTHHHDARVRAPRRSAKLLCISMTVLRLSATPRTQIVQSSGVLRN